MPAKKPAENAPPRPVERLDEAPGGAEVRLVVREEDEHLRLPPLGGDGPLPRGLERGAIAETLSEVVEHERAGSGEEVAL